MNEFPDDVELRDELMRPCLRAVEAFAVEHEGRKMIALRDRSNLSPEVTVVSPSALWVIERFTGERSLDEIATEAGVEAKMFFPLVAHLDKALLLHGERFEEHYLAILDEYDRLEALPIRSARDFTVEWMDSAMEAARESDAYSKWKLTDGGIDAIESIEGIVVPHLDTQRGAINYGLTYAALQDWLSREDAMRFDRVIVFGTNHFGSGTGVVMCEKDQETHAGLSRCDQGLADRLKTGLGEMLTAHRLDHLREHSVELQLGWIRHVVGDVPFLGFLVHDPTVANGGSYDGEGVGLDSFVEELRTMLMKVEGRTLFVASADLSHIGPEFGDEPLNNEARLQEVEARDRAHLSMLMNGELDRFLDSMTEAHNPTKWCTLGGMAAMWRMLEGSGRVSLLNYDQALKHPDYEDLTQCCVASASMLIVTT